MENLIVKFRIKLELVQIKIVRDFINNISADNRLIGIKGARGTGKTTLLLQYIKLNITDLDKVLYVSLDDIYFRMNTLYSLADQFVKFGGELLVLDEVHKYSTWSEELKLIYDDMPNLRIIFTGSSIIGLRKAKADLSRRAVTFEMQGLSFKEFLEFTAGKNFNSYSIQDIINGHQDIALSISKEIKPLIYFNNYLNYGYYPFFMDNIKYYHEKILEVINQIIENDFLSVLDISYATIDKLKAFLMILAESVPFTPNISKLCSRVGVSRNVLIEYLFWLEQSRLILGIHQQGKIITRMQKPQKIYLFHPNLSYSLIGKTSNLGSIRECFFANQLSVKHNVSIPLKGDFVIENQYVFEIGGPDKTFTQIKDIPNSYLAVDQIEVGIKNRIPLWLFGMLE
jgi:uncharacterized protein